MLTMGIDAIINLNKEGYNDREIAIFIGVHRTTVSRARLKYNIPKADINNRKDKIIHCCKCKKAFAIRRKDKKSNGTYYCEECMKTVLEKINKLE